MKIAPISYINSKNYYALNKKNEPTETPVVNTSFAGAGLNGVNGVKAVKKVAPSLKEKLAAALAMVSALNIFANESKNLFSPENALGLYGGAVGKKANDYLRNAYIADPQLYTALAQSQDGSGVRSRNNYSPAEIYGIVKVKQEDPVTAYELSKLLKSPEKNGHLGDHEEVLFIAKKMQEKNELGKKLGKLAYKDSQDWYNDLKASDINLKLNEALINDYNDTNGDKLASEDRLSIVEMNAKNPEFMSKMLELKKLSVEDLYILEDEYKDYKQRIAIDDLVEFLNENAESVANEFRDVLKVPASTSTVLALFSDFISYPEAVKELCANNIPVEHIEELAHIHDKAPGLTLGMYRLFRTNAKNDNNQYFFWSFSQLVSFLEQSIEINDILEQYEKARGHMTFSESYGLVSAYNGDEENKEALNKLVSSSVIKIINPKNINSYLEYIKKNPDKELTKETLKYAADPMSKYFGLS